MEKEKQKLIAQIIDNHKLIGRCMSDDSPDAWLELNISIAQLKSLIFINFEETTNFKKVAEALGVTPPNVTGIIDRLVEQGLVTRVENPQNRRMQMLSLTKTGKSLLKELIERRNAHLSSILTTLKLEELSIIAKGTETLASAAEKIIKTKSTLKNAKKLPTSPTSQGAGIKQHA
jgi:MarR family transcriptional regulator, organic hydroperoxide resistance regulator